MRGKLRGNLECGSAQPSLYKLKWVSFLLGRMWVSKFKGCPQTILFLSYIAYSTYIHTAKMSKVDLLNLNIVVAYGD